MNLVPSLVSPHSHSTMVIQDDMENLSDMEVYVVGTSLTMNDRFTIWATTLPYRGARAAPRAARRRSFNNGPLLNAQTMNYRNQNIVDEVIQHLGLDWRVQELQQFGLVQRAPSQARSRAGSMTRYGSQVSMPGLRRSNSWGNLSAGSISNFSQRSGQSACSGRSRRSSGVFSDSSRSVRFNRQPNLNMDMRLQMRNAWIRRGRRRGRGLGRNRGGQQGVQNGRVSRRGWQQQDGGRARGRGRGQRGHGGYTRDTNFTMMTRSRARNNTNGWNVAGPSWTGAAPRGGRARGRGRGRGTQRGGISQNGMPQLKTLEQLDKELEDYMAGASASLDKQLDEYMAQNMDEDSD